MNKQLKVLTLIVALGFSGMGNAASTVFSTDFNSATPPAEISPGSALITGVQGYTGLGPVGNQFGGNFLRSETYNAVSLQLNNLPAHSAINLAFLFAAIDSLDGSGEIYPQGDYFNVVVDGVTIFNQSFANAAPYQIQSYVSPAGVELARHVDLGFSGPGSYYTDSAYNLGADPIFSNIAHTASTANIQFFFQGGGIQSLNDESWAMDNLTVTVAAAPVPVPAAVWLLGSGLIGLVGVASRNGCGSTTICG